MTLEFKLNLVMPEDARAVFSRGALELTVKLIQASAPKLAKLVAAVLFQPPLPTGHENSCDANQHMFHVQIPNEQVRAIVTVILNIMENEQHKLSPGMVVVANALLKDWLDLARKS